MDALEIVRKAGVPAVAVDGRDRVRACNEAFRCLVGTRPASGEGLHDSLKLRDVFDNRVASGRRPLLEMLAAGEPPNGFRLRIPIEGGSTVETEVSTVVVLNGEPGEYDVVYFFKPVQRRRRSDLAIDRLLERAPLVAETIASDPLARGTLTASQLRVLRQLADGRSTEEVARALGVSPSTVRTHVEHILERTGTHSRTEAVAWALRRGLL